MNDSGQGLEAEEMWTFLERMNWTDPSLDFPSLVPSACEGLGLGRDEAASGQVHSGVESKALFQIR